MTYPDRPVFTGPVYGAPVGPPARPGIVSAAFFAALASGLFSVIGGILEFTGARELVPAGDQPVRGRAQGQNRVGHYGREPLRTAGPRGVAIPPGPCGPSLLTPVAFKDSGHSLRRRVLPLNNRHMFGVAGRT